MSDAVVTAVIGGVAGLLSGAVASIVAPWVHWGIEKRRTQREYRARLVQRWRIILAHPHFERDHMLRDTDYGALEPLLSEAARIQLRRPANQLIIVRGGQGVGDADFSLLQKEIARIEQDWGLV